MHTIKGMPASAASNMASGAPREGTKITEALAPVASTARCTESKTGILPSSTHSPPLPGRVPATTLVPYRTICSVWNKPSPPVMPCTRRRVFLLIRMLMLFRLPTCSFNGLLGRIGERLSRDHLGIGQQFPALFCVRPHQPHYHRDLGFDLSHGRQDAACHFVAA